MKENEKEVSFYNLKQFIRIEVFNILLIKFEFAF